MKAILFIEGGASGAHSNQLQKSCRSGFATLLMACGYQKRMRNSFHAGLVPALLQIEKRDRKDVLKALQDATGGKYQKGDISFKLMAKLNPDTLQLHLPGFKRTRRILKEKLEYQ